MLIRKLNKKRSKAKIGLPIFLLLVSMFFNCKIGQAQNANTNFHWGVKSGINFSQISDFNPYPDTLFYKVKDRMAPLAGVFIRIDISDRLFLSSEFLFSSKGVAFLSDQYLGNYWIGRKNRTKVPFIIRYIEMPVSIGYSIYNQNVKINAIGGISFARRMRARKYVPVQNEESNAYTFKEERWLEVMPFDIGLSIGASIILPFGEHRALIDFKYIIGQKTVVREHRFSQNNSLQLGIGFEF